MMKEMTYKDAVNLAMREEMRRDQDVFLMGEDVGLYGGAFGVSVGMFEEFGEERVRDTPISEAIITGAAAQHSQSLEAWFCHVPGLKVVVPGTPKDAKGLLKTAIRDDNPVVFIEQKTLYKEKGMVPVEDDFIIPLGVGEIKKEGKDVTVVSYGRMLPRVLKVAEELENEGISVEVVDPRTLVPLDKEIIINSVIKTGRAVLVNEACKTGGYLGEIASVIMESEAFDYLDAPIIRLAGLDIPIPYNPVLEKATVPSEEQIRAGILKVLNR